MGAKTLLASGGLIVLGAVVWLTLQDDPEPARLEADAGSAQTSPSSLDDAAHVAAEVSEPDPSPSLPSENPAAEDFVEPPPEALAQALERAFAEGERSRVGVDPTAMPPYEPEESGIGAPVRTEDETEEVRVARERLRQRQLSLVTALSGRVEVAIADAQAQGDEDEVQDLTSTLERLQLRRSNIERAIEEGQ